MLRNIFQQELKYWLKTPSVYIYAAALFGFAFLIFIGTGGLFDPPPDTSENVRVLNSSFEINYLLQYFNKFFLFLLPAIIGASIYKDYKYRMHSIIYTFPIKKSDYLFGKLFSAFLIVALVTFSVGLAFLIGEQVPGLHENKIGPSNFSNYLQVYLFYILPNMMIFGAIVFAMVTLTRNIYAGFITVIILFFIQMIIENILGGLNQPYLLALFDPFAQNTTLYLTQNWTLEDKNTKMLPVESVLIFNRLIWLGIAALIFGVVFKKFRFSEHGILAGLKKQKAKPLLKKAKSFQKIKIESANFNYSFQQQWKNIWTLSNIDLKYIVKSWMFYILVAFGLFSVIFTLARVTNFEEIALIPVTRLMFTVPSIAFSIIILLLTFLYAGMLIHRPQTARMHQLVDTTPTPNWVLIGSKVLALIKMQMILLLVLMIAGMIIQTINGYFNFELGLYLFQLYAILLLPLMIWSFVAIFFQTLIPNTYVGLFVLILGWIGVGGLEDFGVATYLVRFNDAPDTFYSDMDGYAGKLGAYYLVETYWLFLGVMVLILAVLFWVRGFPSTFKERLQIARFRFKNKLAYAMVFLLIGFTSLGFMIYKAENKSTIDTYLTENQNQIFKDFKDKFQKYKYTPQARITDIKINFDLFPESNNFEINGNYTLVNKSGFLIDTIFIKTGFDEITNFELDVAHQQIDQDSFMKFTMLKLDRALQPQDSFHLKFHVENIENTLFERNSSVLGNGTFIKADVLPQIGYSFLEAMEPADSLAGNHNYYALNADLVNIESTISTTENQTAIGPGYLEKKWTADGRNFFKYKTNLPVKFEYALNSADFHLKKEKWNDLDLEIYYHQGHDYNLPQMFNGLKAALDYNTKYFTPYQHREARIIEFPHSEGTYATSMANSIPMSEIRFIANADTASSKVDLAFYVTAHELTHQWWGGQMTPARARGAVMLTESITEYITLQIYAEHYGEKKALQFLQKQRERYLNGRTKKRAMESPLYLVKTPEQYISYGKGTMAFNTISRYLGTDRLNLILKNFLLEHQFKSIPYPTSLDLLERLKTDLPDSLQYLIEDYFETITFYDNKIESMKIKPIDRDNYKVELDFSIRKYRGEKDSGINGALPLADFIQIGFFDENGKTILIKPLRVTQQDNHLTFTLYKKPASVMIDPNYLTIDKDMKDNKKEL